VKSFGWIDTEDEKDWNLFWTDGSVVPDRLKKLKSFQVCFLSVIRFRSVSFLLLVDLPSIFVA
jgi:hypothetical protein